jgi:uncharacterized protein YggU (UPF0235/DUF167 family)
VAAEAPSSWLSRRADGVRLTVRLTPRAARSAVDGVAVDARGASYLAVRVTAPPEGGKAYAALLRLLARHWRLPARDLQLVAGAGARRKIVEVQGAPDRLLAELAATEAAAREA